MLLQNTRTELQVALETFEACLETPLVPGELEAWSNSLQAACMESLARWREELETAHHAQLKQIRRQDSEMGPRVEKLSEEDEAITAEFEPYCRLTTNLCVRSPEMEPDEGRFERLRLDTVAEGIALIIRIRTQQQALRTWYLEAFDRDRGEGD